MSNAKSSTVAPSGNLRISPLGVKTKISPEVGFASKRCVREWAIWQKYLGLALTEEENSQVFRIDDAMLYGLVHNSSRADPCACRNVCAGSCNRCVYRNTWNRNLGCDRDDLSEQITKGTEDGCIAYCGSVISTNFFTHPCPA